MIASASSIGTSARDVRVRAIGDVPAALVDDLVAAGSMADARAAGKVRQEGKDYVMADGDVVEFRFNVT